MRRRLTVAIVIAVLLTGLIMLRNHLDPNNHNGAVFLGLNGVVVKSHGSADEKGVANAVEVAARLVEDSILERITEDLTKISTDTPMTVNAK